MGVGIRETSRQDLDRLFDPRSIAVAGLSADLAKHGGRVLTHLRQLGYSGSVWGVHPQTPEIDGVDMFQSIGDLPHPPDLVVSAVPAASTADVVRDASGVGAVIVFAGGYGESGPAGRTLEDALTTAVKAAGTRLLGPNSGGVIRPGRGLAASFLTCLDRPRDEIRSGPVGVVTQSGGTGSYLHNLAAARGTGLAISVSTGNEVDIKLGEAIDAVSRLAEVSVVLAVIETVRDGAAFIDAVRASTDRGKPVVACRIGTGRGGRAMMTTHTGALAVEEAVLDGVLESLNVMTAETPGEAYDVAEIMAHVGAPSGSSVGIVTHSGGIAIHLADLAEKRGVDLTPPGPGLADDLQHLLDLGAASNPLDMGGIIAGPSRFAEVVAGFARSDDYDLVLAVSTPHPPQHSQSRVESLLSLETNAPIVHLWMAGDQADESLQTLRAAHAPVTDEPRAAMTALAALARMAERRPQGVVDPLEGDPETWGLRFVEGEDAAEVESAVAAAEHLGYPVVLKVVSTTLAHKTDRGGVALNLQNEEALRDAFDRVAAADESSIVRKVRVERYRPGLEMMVGGIVDRVFGPLVSIGLGGVFTELFQDVMFAPAPVGHIEAMAMIDRLVGRELLDGYRGSPPADVCQLADLVSTVSRGLVGSGLLEVEFNPVIWNADEWVVADRLWSH